MLNEMRALAAGAAVALVAVAPASALEVGYDLAFSGSKNVPTLRLTNTSDAGVELLSFSLTIGNTTHNFDEIYTSSFIVPVGGAMSLTFGDTSQGGARTDSLAFDFSGFDAGEVASWDVDIDRDNVNSTESYDSVMFNNGTAPNAVASATFASAALPEVYTLDLTLPDGSLASAYTFEARATLNDPTPPPGAAVPIPAAAPLLAAALAGLGLMKRRRRG